MQHPHARQNLHPPQHLQDCLPWSCLDPELLDDALDAYGGLLLGGGGADDRDFGERLPAVSPAAIAAVAGAAGTAPVGLGTVRGSRWGYHPGCPNLDEASREPPQFSKQIGARLVNEANRVPIPRVSSCICTPVVVSHPSYIHTRCSG
eukprot:356821-Chlamydomonas_euryale.AAC.2